MAWAPVALAATAAVVSTVGALSRGRSEAQASNYQAQVAQNNAQVAEQNAKYAEQAGGVRAQDIQQRGRVAQGRIKTAQAASGIEVNSGSAPMVRAGQAVNTEVDARRAEHDAALTAYGYRTQASGYRAQSGLDRMSASNARTASYFDAGGTLLSAASSIGYKWGSMTGGPGGGSTLGSYQDSTGDWVPGG